MDLDKIRKMNDEELTKLLKQLSKRSSRLCAKCNQPVSYTIKIENSETFQMRKLCSLCEDCYQDLLDYLKVYDIDWDE